MTLSYWLTSLVVVLLPGTGVIYTLSHGLGSGWRASIFAAIGCTLGIVPHIIISIVGLASVLHTSALAFQLVKYCGVAYLFYMAWGVLRDKGGMQLSQAAQPLAAHKIIIMGFLLNILNPKLSLFFLAFLPQFVPSDAAFPTLYMLGLALEFMLLTFIVFVAYGIFAAATRRYIISSPRIMNWMKRGFAAAFVFIGIRLAYSSQSN